ncbi:hypothetical protein BDV59DRAFT_21778 [Aspergillus ambiguus]|uniref:uncharacterized protein n=1 Tax=Aspergillus ambiguus TaxID=176160 RepID=UPI003CCD1D14
MMIKQWFCCRRLWMHRGRNLQGLDARWTQGRSTRGHLAFLPFYVCLFYVMDLGGSAVINAIIFIPDSYPPSVL